ncbi:conserved hypothetical protein [uncultured Thiomicrorhabdus sp.]
MDTTPELKQWLDDREKHLEASRRIAKAGGHAMLRPEIHDPEALDEPMRSEAIQYFDSIRNQSLK